MGFFFVMVEDGGGVCVGGWGGGRGGAVCSRSPAIKESSNISKQLMSLFQYTDSLWWWKSVPVSEAPELHIH